MTSRVKLGWHPAAPAVERFDRHIAEKWGEEDIYRRVGIEEAMRQFMDRDGLLAEAEDLLQEYTDLVALSSSTGVIGTDRYQGVETEKINNRIDADLMEDFKIFADKHDVGYGRLLAAALDSYADGGRARRILDDVRRLVTDGEADASRVEPESEAKESHPDPKIALSIADDLGQSFTAADVADLLADHVDAAGLDLDPAGETVRAYTEAVTAHLDVEPHPNPENDLYIPAAERESLTVYDDLTREARIEELRRYVALDAVQANKSHYAVGYSEVQALFERECADNKGPSHQYAYDLMEDAAEADGYDYCDGCDGTLQLRVAVSETPPRIREWLADHPDVALSTAGGGEDPDADPGGDGADHAAADGTEWVDRAADLLADLPADVPDQVIDNKIARAQVPALIDAETVPAEAVDGVTDAERERVKARLGWGADDAGPDPDADAERATPIRADGGRPLLGGDD